MLAVRDDIELYDSYAKIIFRDKNNVKKGEGYIDLDDVNKVLNRRINLMSNGYVCIKTSENRNIIGLHRFIMGVTDSKLEVDHINGDRSDNRKENLRVCTTSQNFMNRSKYNCNKSGHRGVYWNDKIPTPKWMAYITVNKKRKHLGFFENLEDAVRARKNAEIKIFGEFAPNDVRWSGVEYKRFDEYIKKKNNRDS